MWVCASLNEGRRAGDFSTVDEGVVQELCAIDDREAGPGKEAVRVKGRDLPVTTDFRAVFSEVAGQHFGIDPKIPLFPNWSGDRLPLWRS